MFLKVNCSRVCTLSCLLLLLRLLLSSSLGLPPSTSSTAVCSYVLDCSAHTMPGAVARQRMRCRCRPTVPHLSSSVDLVV